MLGSSVSAVWKLTGSLSDEHVSVAWKLVRDPSDEHIRLCAQAYINIFDNSISAL